MKYKYNRSDIKPLDLRLEHMDICINFQDHVEVTNTLRMTAINDVDLVKLNATDLKIISVKEGHNLGFEYDNNILSIKRPAKAGETFSITTVTLCFPSDLILEGIYKDQTPKSAPQQYVSQCEMWGFQRIMPVIDDPRAKCTMTTTLIADARYTHLISNGDILKPLTVKDGRKTITYDNKVPMAPYLFLAFAGTWDMLEDELKLNGRTIKLEYLVPPGKIESVKIPMEILKKSIRWIMETQDYEYPFDTYRTITVNKADFGGMENVGNTVIVTDAALITEHTLDALLYYAHQVIVHEFEHNQCGSETTMETPFEMWLNEAYTVDVERQFTADVFGETYARLSQVQSIRNPLLGPLAVEDGNYAGLIVRDGFNHPDELIDGVTYVKAAEVIRMLRLIMGKDKFKRAKTLYFRRYKDSNANTEQFFECFEEVHGDSLAEFKSRWLFKKGYPKVKVETSYVNGEYTFQFTQNSNFHIPIELALVDENGKDLITDTIQFKDKEHTISYKTEKPAFASINRDYSFYGTLEYEQEKEELLKQARLDSNKFNRAEAVNKLTDMERIKLIEDPEAEIDTQWLKLYGEILKEDLPNGFKAQLLTITEQPLDRKYAAWYPELFETRQTLLKAVSNIYRKDIIKAFNELDTYSKTTIIDGIKDRALKAVLMMLISVEDTPVTHEILINHYNNATTANDRVTALAALNRSSAPVRREMLDEAYRSWHSDISGYSNYLRIIAGGKHEHYFDELEAEIRRGTFDEKNPTFSRSLVVPVAVNTKMVWTDKGLEWVKNKIIHYSEINSTVASRMLNMFQHVHLFRPKWRDIVAGHLKEIAKVDNPTIKDQASAYIPK